MLVPVLAGLPQPLALLEVGAAAGLCLLPDRYAYRYGERRLGTSRLVLECDATDTVPIPSLLPQVVWRAGIDLEPIDVADPEAVRWLEALVWPDQPHRTVRLRRALGIARDDPPPIVRGDLLASLPEVAARAPAEATLVVFHTAVLAYLDANRRRAFAGQVAALGATWISNEGPGGDRGHLRRPGSSPSRDALRRGAGRPRGGAGRSPRGLARVDLSHPARAAPFVSLTAVADGIGVLREGPLHAELKRALAAPGDRFEVPVGRFVIDLVRADGELVEIQTGGFGPLGPKLDALLDEHRFRIVHPVAAQRRIGRVDGDGQVLSTRASPRRGDVLEVFDRLITFPSLLSHPHLTLEVVLVAEDHVLAPAPVQVRRRTRDPGQRHLVDVLERIEVADAPGLLALLPGLPEGAFTTRELSAQLGCRVLLAQRIVYCLRALGLFELAGKRGRAPLHRLTDAARNNPSASCPLAEESLV